MENLKYGIGIDVSMQKLDVCISVINQGQQTTVLSTSSFPNNVAGFSDLLKRVGKCCKELIPVVFLMEATGIYYEQLAWFLFQKEQTVAVILPNKARKYKEALGLKSKNDAIDAKGLSTMVCEQNIRGWKPISKNIYQLRLITRQIERITQHLTQFKNQLHALGYGIFRDKSIEKMTQQNIALLEKQRAKLEEKIRSMIAADDALDNQFKRICKIKGLGMLTLAVIVAETDGFALIENQSQLVSYAGYDVVENQSGKHVGKTRISKRGNHHIRRALHMPALNMVRYQVAPFLGMYERIYERSKIKMKGYTAVQKKLLLLIYTLWKKEEEYQAEHYSTASKEEERVLSFI